MRDAATPSSLTERTNIAIGAALAGRKRGAFTPLLFAGPAVIASIAYMDPGRGEIRLQPAVGGGDGQPDRHAVPGAVGQARHRHQPQSGGDVPRSVFAAGSDRHVAA